jgi:hypothetical protein
MPESAFSNLEIFIMAVDGDCIGGICLQLYRIRTSILGGVQQADRLLKVLIMIGRQLCYDIGRLFRSDSSSRNMDVRYKINLPLSHLNIFLTHIS